MSAAKILNSIVGASCPFLAAYFLFQTLACLFVIRKDYWRRLLLYVCCWLIITMIIFIGDIVNLPPTLAMFLLGVWNGCEGSKRKRITIGLMTASAVLAFNGLHDNCLARILSWYSFVPDCFHVVPRLIFVLLLYSWIRRRNPSHDFELSKPFWNLLLQLTLIPLGIVLSLVLLRSPFINLAATWLADFILFFLAVFSFVGLFQALLVLERQQRLEQENLLAQQNQSYYEAVEAQQFEIRRLKHDLNNHLQALLVLSEEKRESYIKEMMDNAAYARILVYSGDATVNAVLSIKKALFLEKQIPLCVKVDIPRELPFAKVDICALFSNALDNAAEAAELLPEGERTAVFTARAAKGMLAVSVENSCRMEGEKDVVSGRFKTTKEDSKRHGYGLLSIRKVVEKYGGGMETTLKDGKFTLFVYLPMESQEEGKGGVRPGGFRQAATGKTGAWIPEGSPDSQA